jgi:hypothetical protein
MISRCASEGLEHLDPHKIALRLLASNTMFIFGIAYSFTHCVLDLYGHDDATASGNEFLVGLETECKDVLDKYHGISTKAAVDSLYRVDSTLRESMRLSDPFITSLPMDVMSGKVDLGNEISIPSGIRMVFPTQAMHVDPEFYSNPLKFDAFRFSRDFENAETSGFSRNNQELIVTPTKSFLVFGYGRHACPGRWLVSQIMKQALAYVILNYDVDILEKPSQRKPLLNMMVPPVNAKIRIRRKS